MTDLDSLALRADEKTAMLGFLQFLREVMVAKTEGLDEEQARWTPTPTSNSLLVLIRHLAGVEERWFQGAIGGEHVDVSKRAEEFEPPDDFTLAEAVANYRAAWERSAEVMRSVASLDDPCKSDRTKDRNVRWVLLHMIEETGRHCGHADLTRELIDGTVEDS